MTCCIRTRMHAHTHCSMHRPNIEYTLTHTHLWETWTGVFLEHGDSVHLSICRGHLTHAPMLGEDVLSNIL